MYSNFRPLGSGFGFPVGRMGVTKVLLSSRLNQGVTQAIGLRDESIDTTDFGWDESHPISEWVRTHSADSHWGYGTDEDEIERVVTP